MRKRFQAGRQKIAEGKYLEAESIALEILDERYNPNCAEAKELVAHLRHPGYFNKTMGPKFIAKVEEVKKLLNDAEGYYQAGPLRSGVQEIRAGSGSRSL